MKAILIDVVNETVTDIVYDSKKTLDEWYKNIGCDLVTTAMEFPNEKGTKGNTLFVDDEGLLKLTPQSKFFTIEGGYQPFAGNGLIVGSNYDNGKTIDCSLTADNVRGKVRFHTLEQVRKM